MSMESVAPLNPTLSADGKLLVLDFNHGKANEMGSTELKAFEALSAILEKGEIRVLISSSQRLSRSGKPIFISGANVTERQGWSNEQVKSHVRYQRHVLQRLKAAPCFHIAVVDGIALGWGTEYLLTADYRIGTHRSTFGLPETGLGILPGAGGSSELWAQLGYAHTLRLGMAGERIDGLEAERIGLVQESWENWEGAMDRAQRLAKTALNASPTACAAFKATVQSSMGCSADERQSLEALAYEHCVDTGEAAIGRENFKKIISGEAVTWGRFQPK